MMVFTDLGYLDVARAGADTCPVTTVTIPELPFPLTASGSPPCQYRLGPGALTLTGGASTDLFVDPAGDGPVPDAGRLTGIPPAGDFTLASRVTVDFQSTYDAGVLLLHAGPRRWAKLCFEFSPQRRPTAVTVVTKQMSDDCNSFEVAARTLWLRITRTGRAWAFHSSTDGQWWQLLRYFSLGERDADTGADHPVEIGFLAQSPTGEGCTAIFEEIKLQVGAPADLRDGS